MNAPTEASPRARWLPRGLFGRLTLIVAAGLVLLQCTTMVLHLQDRAALKALLETSGLLAQAPPEVLAQLQLPKAWHPVVMLSTILAVVLGVALVAVRWVTQPLQQLADAAQAFGQHLDGPPLPTTGPLEAQQAAAAFNTMQLQVRALVGERSRALEAVSHDLRTPLMRLRLRAELVDDEALRQRIHADIDAMDAMVGGVLGYLRGLQTTEAPQPLDLTALLESLIDDQQAMGRDVAWTQPPNGAVVVNARLEGLRRALTNLIDNAVAHGRCARLGLACSDTLTCMTVDDEGPGIPEADLQRVLQPYVRLDAARHHPSGGVGLGLAVAHQAALAHGGTLVLSNRTEGGLRATLTLPHTST
ncbi:MAG: ATP-binding protein [Burkholderiaceae bacterium]|nr:ATP-binding protein [Burkholderiaceae bacterium]